MTTPGAGELVCPQCGHSNPPRSDYCWECRFDFLPDDRPKAKQKPPIAPKPIPPPFSQTPPAPKPARPSVSFPLLLIELAVSTVIVWGSWMVLSFAFPTMGLIPFAIGWAGALLVVVLSEGRIPEVEQDFSKYWSLNPFNFEDDRNWRVLNWHIMLFLPRIVLRTLRHGLGVFSSPR